MVDSGYASDSAALPGVASLALRMLEEGTPSRDSLRIGEDLEALGATFNTGINLDGATINMNLLKPTLPKSLDLYADLVLHPAFPQKEFTRLQKDRLAAIQREKTTPQTMGMRVIPALLYGRATRTRCR
jgi:zinc protease